MIIVEGSDATGKTTFARALAEATGLEYKHMGPPPADIDPTYYTDKIGPYVWDRFHLGEEAYGRMGGSRIMSWQERCTVRHELLRRGVFVIVLATFNDEWMRQRANESGKQMYSVQEIVLANKLFSLIAVNANWTDWWMDVSTGYPDSAHVAAVNALWQRQWQHQE